MSDRKPPQDVPLDDVAGLFARLGERDGVAYRVFSMSELKEPAVVPAASVVQEQPEPTPALAAAPPVVAVQPAPAAVRVNPIALHEVAGHARQGGARPAAPTPLQQLFQRLAEGRAVELAGEASPLRRLLP